MPQYEKSESAAEYGQLARYDPPPVDAHGKDVQYLESVGPSNSSKQRRSLDTPLSLASLSSRSSLSSLSPPSSPLDTPFLPASQDSPLAQRSEGYEDTMGTGALDVLRAQVLGEDKAQETVSAKAPEYSTSGEGLREVGLTNIPSSGGKLIFSHIFLSCGILKTQQNA